MDAAGEVLIEGEVGGSLDSPLSKGSPSPFTVAPVLLAMTAFKKVEYNLGVWSGPTATFSNISANSFTNLIVFSSSIKDLSSGRKSCDKIGRKSNETQRVKSIATYLEEG